MPGSTADALKHYAWDEPKKARDLPRAAGPLLETHIRADRDLREREEQLRDAVADAEHSGDPTPLYQAHHQLGLHLEIAGALDAAAQSLHHAVDACADNPSLARHLAVASNDYGVTLARLGRNEEAEQSFAVALEADPVGAEGKVESAVQRNRALIAWTAGEPGTALDLWNAAFRSSREKDDAASNAQILNNVAVLKLIDEESDEALRLLNRAVLLAQRGGDLRALACMYNNLGLVFSGPPRGDHSGAIPFVEMSLALLSGAIDVLARLYVLNNNIIVYEQAHLEPARKFRKQFADTLKTFPFAYPSRSADVERAALVRPGLSTTNGDGEDREWTISAHPALLSCCARCGVVDEAR